MTQTSESKVCGVCHGHGELKPASYGAREPVIPFSCNFCGGKGRVFTVDEAAYMRLLNAVAKVYYAAWYTPDRGDPEANTKLWTELRDAAGFVPGAATAALGPKREPKPDAVDRTMVKRAVYAAMFTPELWRNAGLDPQLFIGAKPDLYDKLTRELNDKPLVIFPTSDSPRNYCERLNLPHSRIRAVTEREQIIGLSPSTVVYDPFSLSQVQFNPWREWLAIYRLFNIVSGKALVQSVLAGRFGL